MATYIGFNTTNLSYNISLTDFYYVVDPSKGKSYPLLLLRTAPYSINGVNYIVYMIGDGTNYTLTSSWFVHLYDDDSITSTSDLPIDSQIIYATYSTVTFSSPGNYPQGELYRFSTTVQKVNSSNTWITGKNPGGVAGTGTPYTYYNKLSSTTSSGQCTNYGFSPTSSSDGVSIVELYHSTNGVANATGLYTSIINRSASSTDWHKGTHKKWIYDYVNESDTSSNNPTRINGKGRKVSAIHNTTGGDCNLAIAYGGNTSASFNTNYTIGSFGYTKVAYNTWAHHTTQDGKHYYSITVNKNNQFIETTLQLEANKAYKIKMHTYSGADEDGIIISTTKLSLGFITSSGITSCSGVNIKKEHNIEPSSSAIKLYIYFKTNSANLYGPGGTHFDSSGGAPSTTTYGHSTGDIEIFSYVYTITFNTNGGAGGTRYATVVPGESLDLSTITKPTRTGWDFYKWSTSNNPFKFVSSPYKPTGNVTLYAIWDNFPKFTELSDKSVYCTDDCIAASSTQGSKSIKLFSGTGMTCSAGTVTYMSNISKVYPVGSPTSPISGATIQPLGTDNNVTVPEGTPAGDYIADIVVYTSLSMGSTGSYYGPTSSDPALYRIQFTIKATTLTYGPVELIQHTPDDIIEGNITQQKNFPASQFTISPSTIGDYFSPNGVFRQMVTCNNGTRREGNVTVNGWAPTPGFKDIVVPSLGTTISDEYTYTFASSNGNALVFDVAGEGGTIFRKFILSGVREANYIEFTNYNPSNYTASVVIGDGLTAAGGRAIVTASASHIEYDLYTSGAYNNPHDVSDTAKWMMTSNGNMRFSHPSSGGTSLSGVGTVYDSGIYISHSNMTNNETTDTVTVTAYNIEKTYVTASAEKSITNSLNTTKYKDTSGTTGYNIVYNKPTVAIGSGLNAAGGRATVTCSVTNETNWYQKYTSGTYTGQQTGTEAGIARWMITSNGNSRFSHPSSGGSSLSGVGTVYDSGTSVSHGNMTTIATTDTVTVTAYNVGDISKTNAASTSVSNELTSISLSLGSSSINYNSTTTATVTATYTSGSSKDVTSSLSTSPSATSNYIKSGDTSVVTVS